MKQFTLLNVKKRNEDGTVEGYWVQDHIGTLESARKRAEEVNEVNSNRLDIEVVEKIPHTRPDLAGLIRARKAA